MDTKHCQSCQRPERCETEQICLDKYEQEKVNRPSGEAPCSALSDALALVDFGPCRGSAEPAKWMLFAGPMCAHCADLENVDQAAARILAAAYKELWFALGQVRHNAIAIQNIRWGYDGDCGAVRIAERIEYECDQFLRANARAMTPAKDQANDQ